MIDYRAHVATLETLKGALSQSPMPDAAASALRDATMQACAEKPGLAILGALIDHLVWHSASDGSEVKLLERTSDLWSEALDFLERLGALRAALEAALANPNDASALANYKAASAALHPLVVGIKDKVRQIHEVRREAHSFRHVPPHPRQEDRTIEAWRWDNLFLARRTDAFVRSAARRANDAATRAFATGILASYGGNACGSAYLGQAVGGPRRAHRLRDRIARNAVGSWFAKNDPAVPPLAEMVARMKADAPILPAAIKDLIRAAFEEAFDPDIVPAHPDLEFGYDRLLRHIDLLSTFRLPPPPNPPAEPFLTQLYADPANPPDSVVPEIVAVEPPPGGWPQGGGGVTPQNNSYPDALNNADAPDSTEVKCGGFWEAVGLGLLFVLGGHWACFIQWANGDRCELTDDIDDAWERAFPEGVYAQPEYETDWPQALTASDMQNALDAGQMTKVVGHLFDLHTLAWESLNASYDFLAGHGLIYPDERLSRPIFRQFVSLPAKPRGSWPQKTEPDPNKLHLYPTTGTEQPSSESQTYAAGSPPAVFLGPPGQPAQTASEIAMFVWIQIATGILDASNLDLDADRGLRHPCWRTGGSINDAPVSVDVLGYAEI